MARKFKAPKENVQKRQEIMLTLYCSARFTFSCIFSIERFLEPAAGNAKGGLRPCGFLSPTANR